MRHFRRIAASIRRHRIADCKDVASGSVIRQTRPRPFQEVNELTLKQETQSLLQLERRFWDAIKRKDGPAMAKLTADNCIVTGAQGVSAINPSMMEKLTIEGAWTLEQYDFDEATAQATMLGPDTGIVGYTVTERLTVAGKPLTLQANDSSVWVRHNDEWRCALHTEAFEGDPFGRDRKRGG